MPDAVLGRVTVISPASGPVQVQATFDESLNVPGKALELMVAGLLFEGLLAVIMPQKKAVEPIRRIEVPTPTIPGPARPT